jgi:signal transduction histidine kinase
LIEFQICHAEGTLIDAEAYYVPDILPGRHLLVVHDITERKLMEKQRAELEAQIQQVKKQEALAVLAGGVAHDFNNLLATMLGNANLASMIVEPDSKVMSYMAAIEKAAMRAAKLTRQMVAYTGQGKYHKGEVDLNLVLREAMLHFSDSMPPQVNVHLLLSDRLPFVQGDSTQFSEILVNLLTNAVEAMEAGRDSRLLLRTRGEYLDQTAIDRGSWALPVVKGHYTTVEVVDEGAGMGPDVVDRLFEPFFSTKFAGRGLGLAEVIGVVRNHGGGVQVQSEPGKGSSFKIFLPAMRAPRSLHPRDSSTAWRGEGQILVVDDEKEERNKVRNMAEELGFTVIEATNGMEAVELFRLHHGDLALVLLDLSLPLADAGVALGEILKIDINVPVVVGYPYWAKEEDLPVVVQAGSLRKPYRLAEFRGLLQRTVA